MISQNYGTLWSKTNERCLLLALGIWALGLWLAAYGESLNLRINVKGFYGEKILFYMIHERLPS